MSNKKASKEQRIVHPVRNLFRTSCLGSGNPSHIRGQDSMHRVYSFALTITVCTKTIYPEEYHVMGTPECGDLEPPREVSFFYSRETRSPFHIFRY